MGESREERQRACTSGAFPPVAERARLPEHIPALAQEADWSPKPANKRADLYIEKVARSSPERVPGAMRRRRLGQRPDSKMESDAPATVSADGRLVAVAFDRAIESFYSLGLEAKGHLAPVSRVFPPKCCLSERAAKARSACLFFVRLATVHYRYSSNLARGALWVKVKPTAKRSRSEGFPSSHFLTRPLPSPTHDSPFTCRDTGDCCAPLKA